MSTNEITAIQTGMEVFSTDGETIGEVERVWPGGDSIMPSRASTTHHESDGLTVEPLPRPGVETEALASDTAASSGTPGGTMGDAGYFQVTHGGVLGIGTTELYIPFSSVTGLVPGDNVTIDCSKDECSERYGRKPDFLETSGDPGGFT